MKIIFIIVLLLQCSLFEAFCAQETKKPNIIFIMADDMGPGDVSAYNTSGKIPTPNIDRIAKEGMKFMDAHTSSSICTPTRYGILTGRYTWRTHHKERVLNMYSPPLIKPERETLPSFLKKQGYATGCVGKWHLGWEWTSNLPANSQQKINATTIDPTAPIKNGPLDRGFDYFFGTPQSELFYIENDRILGELTLLKTKEEIIARSYVHKRYSPCWAATGHDQRKVLRTVAEKSTEWIESQAKNPFFLYLPLPSPHNPIVPSEDFEGKSGLNPHADYCMETDWVVGQVLQKLDELKIAENTLVIFTADNGTSASNNIYEVLQSMGHYPSWIYRGCKWTLWEGGHRMPFVVRWPNGIKAGQESTQTICTTDLFATCADVLGVKKLAGNVAEDSYSYLPALKNKKIKGSEDRLIVHASFLGQFAVRKGKWKLLFDNKGGTHYEVQRNPKDANNPIINNADILLFDMENDAVESTNLSAEYPEVVEELKKEFAEIIKNGRSTPGESQPTDLHDPDLNWPQIEKVKEYVYKK